MDASIILYCTVYDTVQYSDQHWTDVEGQGKSGGKKHCSIILHLQPLKPFVLLITFS